jgi:steroid 5-alpha reductase family enzyme
MDLFNLICQIKIESLIIIAFNLFTYLFHAIPYNSDKFYDLTGALSFITVIIYSLIVNTPKTIESWIISFFGLIWSSRLGFYLFKRILKYGLDKRFGNFRANPITFFIPFVIQIFWTLSLVTPIILLNKNDSEKKQNFWSIFGILLWIVGFSIEVISDMQKINFLQAGLRNTEGFISTGLWSISRHPNYLGEILLWLGISIVSYNKIRNLIVFIAPITTFILLRFISGVPLLEKNDIKRFGNNKKYLEYKKNTPVLFFNPLKLFNILLN